MENLPCVHLLVPNNTYVTSTEKFDGWNLKPGNSAFLACSDFVGVYAK